jgi:hypothetical protein
MVHFSMGNDGNEVNISLHINVVTLIVFLKRLTALIIALTALVGAIIQFGALLHWWR